MAPAPPVLRRYGAALRAVVVLTAVLGLGYPLAMTGVAQLALGADADGSLVVRDGAVVGSTLIGQSFGGPDGPDPAYFQGRPSAAGDGYDALASSASNLGPESPELVALVHDRRAAVAELERVDPAAVPPDALLASGSGLDPHISPAYAALQVARVARARGLRDDVVRRLVDDATTGRALGFLGEAHVNVLLLNLALDDLARPDVARRR